MLAGLVFLLNAHPIGRMKFVDKPALKIQSLREYQANARAAKKGNFTALVQICPGAEPGKPLARQHANQIGS